MNQFQHFNQDHLISLYSSQELILFNNLFQTKAKQLAHQIKSHFRQNLFFQIKNQFIKQLNLEIPGIQQQLPESFDSVKIDQKKFLECILNRFEYLCNQHTEQIKQLTAYNNQQIMNLKNKYQQDIYTIEQKHTKTIFNISQASKKERQILQRQVNELKLELINTNAEFFKFKNNFFQINQLNQKQIQTCNQTISQLNDNLYLKDRTIKDFECQVSSYKKIIRQLQQIIQIVNMDIECVKNKMYTIQLETSQLNFSYQKDKIKSLINKFDLQKYLFNRITELNGFQKIFVGQTFNDINDKLKQCENIKIDLNIQQIKDNYYLMENILYKTVNQYKNKYQRCKEDSARCLKQKQSKIQQINKEFISNQQKLCEKIQFLSKRNNELNELLGQSTKIRKITQNQIESYINSLKMKQKQLQLNNKKIEELKNMILSFESAQKNQSQSLNEYKMENQKLKIEKISLQENLLMINQMNDNKTCKEKDIIQQIVEKNYESKITIKQLMEQRDQEKQRNSQLKHELQNLKSEFIQFQQIFKSEIETKEQKINQLTMDNQQYLKINQQLQNKTKELDCQLSQFEVISNTLEQLQKEIQQANTCSNFYKQKFLNTQSILSRLIAQNEELKIEKKKFIQKQIMSLENKKIIQDKQDRIKILTIENKKLNEIKEQKIKILIVQHEKVNAQKDQTIKTLNGNLQECKIKNNQLQKQVSNLIHQLKEANLQILNYRQQSMKLNETISFREMSKQRDISFRQKNMNLNQTLKTRENQNPLKDKYAKNILNLNELINYMINYIKGYNFRNEQQFRKNSWIVNEGPDYIKRILIRSNLQSKYENYCRIVEITNSDQKIRDLVNNFQHIMDYYFDNLVNI